MQRLMDWIARRRRWIVGGIVAIGTFILIAAVAGIIGNRSDAGFIWLWEFFTDPTPKLMMIEERWLMLITATIFIVIIIPVVLALVRFSAAQQRATKLNELDGSLFRLLAQLPYIPNKDDALEKLIDDFLEKTLDLFDDGHRISILCPDSSTPDYLTIWRSLRLSNETVTRTRFYIGNEDEDRQRGIAGHVFLEGRTRVVHFEKRNGQWQPDDIEYKVFVKRADPHYRAIVGTPLLGVNDKCIGVLCIDSQSRAAFDSKKVQDLLLDVGRHLAAAIIVGRALQQNDKNDHC